MTSIATNQEHTPSTAAEIANQHPQTLDQLKSAQERIANKYKGDDSPTEIPAEYAEKLKRGPRSVEDVLSRVDQMTARPQKHFHSELSYDDARQIVWRICQRKSALQRRQFEVDKHNKPIIQNLIRYFIGDEDCEWDTSKGLMIFGNVGLGKTYLMSVMKAFADAADIDFRKFRFHVCADIVDQVEADGAVAMHKYFSDRHDICFDDLGQEPTLLQRYGNSMTVMERILTKRYANFVNGKCITHLTTNLAPEEIEPRYGTRLADRFNEMFNFIFLDGDSRRR